MQSEKSNIGWIIMLYILSILFYVRNDVFGAERIKIYRDRFGIWYKFQKGDTLRKVSYKFHVKLSIIVDTNNIYKASDIDEGEFIFIPMDEKTLVKYNRYPFINKGAFVDKKFDFVWPTKGLVTWVLERRGRSLHYGVDVAARIGTWIRASKEGIVRFAGWVSGYGRLVIVQHDRFFETRYAHCSRLLVKKGDKVHKGEIIALVGSTGRSSGPHLHFEIRYMDIPLQPVHFLKPVAKYFRLKYPNLAEHRSFIDAQKEVLESKR